MQKDNVKELDQNGTIYVVKFATNSEKKILLQDEIRNLNKIQSKNIPGVIRVEHFVDSKENTLLVTKKLFGLFGHVNLRTLLFSDCVLHDLWFREILFQIIYTVGLLQHCFPGFRHNDLKCDNVLLHVSSQDMIFTCPLSNKKWKLTSGIQTFLIDFEVATSAESLTSRSITLESCQEYGLSIERCDMFDIHLLFAELRISAPFRNWGPSFLLFCTDFFQEDMFTNETCTSQLRMKTETQKKCMTERWSTYDHFIFRLLNHEYFGHLRCRL